MTKKKTNINTFTEKIDSAIKKGFRFLNIKLAEADSVIFQSKKFLMCLSLLISVALWAFVAYDDNSDAARTISAKIKYVNLPNAFSVYSSTQNVEVKVAGEINAISSLKPANIIAEVDLSNLQPGKYNLPIRLETPSFAQIRSWQPSTVEVEVFREVERTLPVVAKIAGNPPEGMVVGEVKLNPKEAVIKGHENDVLSVQGLEAEVKLNDLDKEGNATANIIIKSAAEQQADGTLVTRRIKISPTKTVASVKFENEIVGERIPVKVSVVGEPLEGLQVESIKVIPDSVSIRGRSTAVKKMKSLVLPPVDITGLDQNIQLVIPMQPEQLDPDVEITGTDRARVEIRLTKKIVAKSFANIPLAVEGADKNKEWKVTPHAVTLIIEGSQKAIDSLGRSGAAPCKLYVDVSDIVSDQMELPVLVKDLKNDLQIVRIEPDQVKVTTVRD